MARQSAPFPFDCMINSAGYMLASEGRDLSWQERRVAEVEQTLPLRDSDVQYTLTPPRVEIPYAVTDLSGGIGFPQQHPDYRDVYEGSSHADCSAGLAIRGPAKTAQQQVTFGGGGVPQFIEFNAVLYCITGTRIYKRANDTGTGWSLVTTMGAAVSGKCAVFRGSQSAAFLFVPQGTGANYQVMSTAESFTAHASQKAEGFEVVNDEIWLHNTESNLQVIRKATDGGTAATWGGTTTIGDAKYLITWLQNVGGRLVVIKEDGLYGPTIQDESVIDRELTPDLRPLAASGNGRYAQVFNGELWWTMKGQVFSYNPDSGELACRTPSYGGSIAFRLYDAPVVCLAAQPGICVWASVKMEIDPLVLGATGVAESHLMRFGGWPPSRNPNAAQRREFRPVWHGSIFKFSSSDNTSVLAFAYVPSSTTTRLYRLDTDGSISYYSIADTPAPSESSIYSVTSLEGLVLYPWFTLNTPLESKVLRRIGLAGWNTGANRAITGYYRTSPTSTFTTIGSITADPGSAVAVSGTPSIKMAQFRAGLSGTDNGALSNAARLAAFVVYCAVRSGSYKEIVCQVLTSDNIRDRLGVPSKRSGSDLRTALETAIDGNPFTVISPGGESMSVVGLDYEHKLEGYDSTGVARYRTTLRFVEVA